MNKNIHQEFAFQSQELGAQISDTLGEPPDRKNYARVITSLLEEYAKGTEIDDVNMLSFALYDHLRFDDPAGLLGQCSQYDKGDATKVIAMVSCLTDEATKALASVAGNDPELARKAIITAFLYKNSKRWMPEDTAPEDDEDGDKHIEDDEDAERSGPGQDFMDLFDTREDRNG